MLSDTSHLKSILYNLIFTQDQNKGSPGQFLSWILAIWPNVLHFWDFLFPLSTFFNILYIFELKQEKLLLNSNFLSPQLDRYTDSPSYLPIHKNYWVQLKSKTLLKKISLGEFDVGRTNPEKNFGLSRKWCLQVYRSFAKYLYFVHFWWWKMLERTR